MTVRGLNNEVNLARELNRLDWSRMVYFSKLSKDNIVERVSEDVERCIKRGDIEKFDLDKVNLNLGDSHIEQSKPK